MVHITGTCSGHGGGGGGGGGGGDQSVEFVASRLKHAVAYLSSMKSVLDVGDLVNVELGVC